MTDSGDLHEAVFRWPDVHATEVILTGTFDQWSASIHLAKGESGFEGSAKVSWGERVEYKFIVDGRWTTTDREPTTTDPLGNVNNVYTAPVKPAPPTLEAVPVVLAPEAAEPTQKKSDSDNAPATEAIDNTVMEHEGIEGPTIPAVSESVKEVLPQSSNGYVEHSTGLSDLASTVAARDGTTSAIGYIASGLGAAIQSVVGVDPINEDKIAVPPPQPDAQIVRPEITIQSPSEAVPHAGPQSVAPEVPIPIVPLSFETTAEPPASTSSPPPAPGSTPSDAPKDEAPAAAVSEQPSTHAPVNFTAAEPVANKAVSDDAGPTIVPNTSAETTVPCAADVPTIVSEPQPEEQAVTGVSTVAKPPSASGSPASLTDPPPQANGSVPPEAEAGTKEPNGGSVAVDTAGVPSAPSTPAQKPFPTSGSNSAPSSPTSSRVATLSSVRKKRNSIFGKIKHVFSSADKEKGGKEKTKK